MNWCEGKAIRIEQATGGVGEIQILRVSRHDGVTDMSYGNWIEDVPANPASDDNPPSETAEFASLYKVVGTGDQWSGEVVKIDKLGVIYHQISLLDGSTEWTNIKHKCLTPISSIEAAILQDRTKLAHTVLGEFGFSVGDAVDWIVQDGHSLKGTISKLTKLGAFVDEGCPGHTWVEYERLNKIPVEEQKAAVLVDRQEQLARERAKEEITKTAKLIKQSNREIALSEEYLRQQSRYGDDLTRAQDKIATNVNRRFQQIARVIDYAQLNGIWLIIVRLLLLTSSHPVSG